jgi:hypothetical protein
MLYTGRLITLAQSEQPKHRGSRTKPDMSLVSAAYIGLLVLVAATPVFLFFDDLVVAGVIQLYTAVGMMIVAMGIRPGEARHIFKLVRGPAVLAAIPLLWMLIQLLPISIGGLSRSIWESATSALETNRLSASITIDPGLTLITIFRFAAMAGVAFIAAVVSVDRQHVKNLLLLLASAAAVISLLVLASQPVGFGSMFEAGANDMRAIMAAAGIIGIILFAVSLIMAVEQYERRRQTRPVFLQASVSIGLLVAGFVICLSAVIAGDTSHAIFAAACGLTTVAIFYGVRRSGFGPRGGLAIGCVAIVVVAVIVWTKGNDTIGDATLRYATDANSLTLTVDSRIVHAVGLAGSGAGTFAAVSTIYGTQASSHVRPATFAAKIAIELGRPALWVIVGLACTLMIMLVRGAFDRGRDYSYPLAGAGVMVAIALDCFTNTALANPAISLLTAVTLGLGFGQSSGRKL